MSDTIRCETDCVVCGKILQPTGEDRCEMVAFVGRGKAEVCPNEDDHGNSDVCLVDNIKFLRMICETCFLEDGDLCRFFNKLGLRVR
jgi:hypothetical protein